MRCSETALGPDLRGEKADDQPEPDDWKVKESLAHVVIRRRAPL